MAMTADTPIYGQLDKSSATDILCDGEKYLVLFHVHPDGDATGSAFALREMIKATGRDAYCVCADEVPERLWFISKPAQESVLFDSIPEDFCYDRVVSVDTASPTQLG